MMRQRLNAALRHAITAAQVAAIGDGEAQIIDGAAEIILQQRISLKVVAFVGG
jgi:hypothetical protein